MQAGIAGYTMIFSENVVTVFDDQEKSQKNNKINKQP